MLHFHGQTVFTTIEEILAPNHTLLLLYDIMNITCGRTSQTLTRGGYTNAVPNMIPQCERLLAAARKAGVPVAYTRVPSNYAWASGPWIRYSMKYQGISDPERLPSVPHDSPDAQIVEELRPQPGDFVITKYYNSAFSGTNLLQLLQARGVKTLVLTGVATESGIETTARQALIEGYYAVIPTDCINSSHLELHKGALEYLTRCAELTTADAVIRVWGALS